MNWEVILKNKLKNRIQSSFLNDGKEFIRLQTEVIDPTLKRIKIMLVEARINCSLGSNESSISVGYRGVSEKLFKLVFSGASDKVLIETIHYNPMSMIGMEDEHPKQASKKEYIEMGSITEELVAETFMDRFDKFSKHFKLED